jgi:general secretion pathway protein K
MKRLWAKLRAPVRLQRNTQRGVALLMVLTWIALAVALISEFSYGTSVDAAQAANARDELRAHYLARSSINLSRMLIKIQKQFVDPVMAQAQQMLGAAMNAGNKGAAGAGGQQNTAAGLGFSLRVTDYAGPLMGFFSGSKDEVAGLGSLIGIDTSGVKGLGLKSGHFDAEITSEDGKIDINCPGGLILDDTQKKRQQLVYRLLMGLMYSPRFERLFSEADSSGQFATRNDVARAILDWADPDETMFSPDGVAGSGEDYRYDARDDRYRARNNAYDSLEEVKMVRGVSDAFMEAFGPHLTVYAAGGGTNNACKVNLTAISNKNGGDCTPLLMGIIRAAVLADPNKPPADPAVLDDTRLYPLASVMCDRASTGGFDSLNAITAIMQNPMTAVMPDDPRYKIFQSMRPITVSPAELGAVAYTASPRVYKIVAVGEAGKVKKKITVIVDSARSVTNPLQTLNPMAERAAGVIQYWREE